MCSGVNVKLCCSLVLVEYGNVNFSVVKWISSNFSGNTNSSSSFAVHSSILVFEEPMEKHEQILDQNL